MQGKGIRVRSLLLVGTLAIALCGGVMAVSASAATLHQYGGGGCAYGTYFNGYQCMPTNNGYPSGYPGTYPGGNQFGCPAGNFYDGAQCVPNRYNSYPQACANGYYFDGYACSFAGNNQPGPPVRATPLPRPYVRHYGPPPPPSAIRSAQHVHQTLPFTGAETDRLLGLGVSLVLAGLLLVASREVRNHMKA
jgi:hypothetical protein